ncbi:MAG: hypothetical protein M0R76_08090 [Proteobacteria bacterium]|nr:hypothetical protein [Pseudomonadota bacterium]
MKHTTSSKTWLFGLLLLGALALSQNAHALDKPFSRQGMFAGMGLGGGVSALIDGDPLGDLTAHLQLGAGIGERLTLALNLEAHWQIGSDYFGTTLAPGVDLRIFLFKGLYLRVLPAMALAWLEAPDNFSVGFSGGLGLGYEMWFNTQWAGSFGLQTDYTHFANASDRIFAGLIFGIRYY